MQVCISKTLTAIVVMGSLSAAVEFAAQNESGAPPRLAVDKKWFALKPDQLKWTKNSDRSGRESSPVFGDRNKPQLFGCLVKWPPNTIAKAHTHPDDRYAVVLSGTFYHGHGRKFDPDGLERLSRGVFFSEPANVPHYGATKDEETILYFVGIGPDRIEEVEK